MCICLSLPWERNFSLTSYIHFCLKGIRQSLLWVHVAFFFLKWLKIAVILVNASCLQVVREKNEKNRNGMNQTSQGSASVEATVPTSFSAPCNSTAVTELEDLLDVVSLYSRQSSNCPDMTMPPINSHPLQNVEFLKIWSSFFRDCFNILPLFPHCALSTLFSFKIV